MSQPMTLSPTALEAAAKVMCREMDDAWKDGRDYWKSVATAAITAYLAQAGKEGWVMVPRTLSDAEVNLALGREADAHVTPMHSMFRDFHNNVVRAAAAQNGEDLPAPPMGK